MGDIVKSPRVLLNELPPLDIANALLKTGHHVDENGCHIWSSYLATNGYARVRINGINCAAHRASWVLKNGPMDEGKDACHVCDNRACINPDHIFPGSRSENMIDAREKGRISAYLYPEKLPRGERHGSAKLRESDVAEIIRSNDSTQNLAEKFSVHVRTIRRIRSGQLWKAAAIRALMAKEGGNG